MPFFFQTEHPPTFNYHSNLGVNIAAVPIMMADELMNLGHNLQ